jgi:serine/threonine protein kinase
MNTGRTFFRTRPLASFARQSATGSTLLSAHASRPARSASGGQMLRVGQVLCGKYRIDAVLGAGSMGVVVAAQHLQLGIPVAIKALRPEARANAEAVARFEREARAAAHIRGEHVVRVLDVGSLDDGTPFMVMERLEGEDLARRLEREGQLPVDEAVEWILQACEAVGEAHGLGIVHRDLKPENLFCARRPDGSSAIKVLDFGISKMGSMQMTETQACVGSPCYMSPEQLRSSRRVDARTDIWALGAVLYELLTGAVPFWGDTMPELCTRILHTPPTPIRDLRAEVPEELAAVIERCLAKDRADRIANVADLAAALAPFGPAFAPTRTLSIARLVAPQAPPACAETSAIVLRCPEPSHVSIAAAPPASVAPVSLASPERTLASRVELPLVPAGPSSVRAERSPRRSSVRVVVAALACAGAAALAWRGSPGEEIVSKAMISVPPASAATAMAPVASAVRLAAAPAPGPAPASTPAPASAAAPALAPTPALTRAPAAAPFRPAVVRPKSLYDERK